MPDELNKGLGSQMEKEPEANNTKRTNHLFVIGIDDYLHQPKLNNCKRDCDWLVEVLTTKYEFSSENVIKLYDDDATFDKIIAQFGEYVNTLTEKDNLLVYFSGHGFLHDLTGLGYWIPVGGDQSTSTYIPNGLIRDYIKVIKAHHIFLMLDSCFSGNLFSVFKSVRNLYDRLETDPSRWALTAGRNEVVTEGALGDHSPFANSLIGFLERTEKAISTQLLCAKVVEGVGSNADQLPRGEPLHGVNHQGGQFIFRRKAISQSDQEDAPDELKLLEKTAKRSLDKSAKERLEESTKLDFIQKLEIKGRLEEAEIYTEKLTYLRKEFAIKAEGPHKFQLLKEIQAAEKEMAVVVEKIKEIQER